MFSLFQKALTSCCLFCHQLCFGQTLLKSTKPDRRVADRHCHVQGEPSRHTRRRASFFFLVLKNVFLNENYNNTVSNVRAMCGIQSSLYNIGPKPCFRDFVFRANFLINDSTAIERKCFFNNIFRSVSTSLVMETHPVWWLGVVNSRIEKDWGFTSHLTTYAIVTLTSTSHLTADTKREQQTNNEQTLCTGIVRFCLCMSLWFIRHNP